MMPGTRSVFFGNSPLTYTALNPRALGFDEGKEGFDSGRFPSCAINGKDQFIEVHMGESSSTLNFRQGNLERLDLRLTDKRGRSKIGDGNNPAVAYNDDNVAIVLADQNNKVRYAAAKVDPNADANPPFTFVEFSENGATFPSVALNAAGVVLEVHQVANDVVYRRGKLDGTKLTWAPSTTKLVANGAHPSVAINDNGAVVVFFERAGRLLYLTGSFATSSSAVDAPVTFQTPATPFQNDGARPSVALTGRGEVFVVYKAGTRPVQLFQAVGLLQAGVILFQDFLVPLKTVYAYDTGAGETVVHIATNGKVAMQLYNGGNRNLFGNASLVVNRASWMSDHSELRDKTLRRIALPGSHDAGAFAVDAAQTQDLNFLQQLRYGVRYFDLRPLYSGGANPIDPLKITTYHDITLRPGVFKGPTFIEIVRDLRTFLQANHELVILRISQFSNFNANVFSKFVDIFLGDGKTIGIKKWLFKPKDDGTRLADRPLSDYLTTDGGTVLVVVDKDGANDYITDDNRKQGFYRYRDWFATDPEKGDLTVFDVFSDTNTFDTMAINPSSSTYGLPRGQLNKFDKFKGKCLNNDKVQCDLFLLSWTLTPSDPSRLEANAFNGAKEANRNLTSYLAIPRYQSANPDNLRMNILYTDAVELSRSVDVALIRNGIGR